MLANGRNRFLTYCDVRLCLLKIAVTYRRFQLRSRFNGKMLVVSSYPQHTAPVEMSDSFFSGDYNQLWYLDEDGVIHSVSTGFCLTSQGILNWLYHYLCDIGNR